MQVSLLMLWLLPFPWWVRATDPNLFTGNHFMETLLLAQNFCSIIHSEWVISSLWAEVTVNAQDVNKMKRGGQRAKTAFQIKMNVLCTCSLLSTVMSHGAPSSQLPHLTPLPPWKEIWHELTKSFNSQWVIPTPQCVDFSGLVCPCIWLHSRPRAEFGLHQLKSICLVRAQEKIKIVNPKCEITELV